MSKNIIVRLFNAVKRHVEVASQLIESVPRPGRDLLVKMEQAHQVEASFVSLINAEPLTADDVAWEHEGGDPTLSPKLLVSAMLTAYTAAYHNWCREAGLYTDFRETPAEHQRDVDVKEAAGLTTSEWEHVPYSVCLDSAMAVYARAYHLANFTTGEFRYLHGFDVEEAGEKHTVRVLMPISEWAVRQAEESKDAMRAERLRLFSEEVKDDWHHMAIDEAAQLLSVWLDEVTEDRDGHHTRRQRIVERVADRVFDDMTLGIMSSDHKRTLKAFKLWELLLASPKLHRTMQDYKGSREYKLEHMQQIADKLQAAIAEKEEKARLDAMEAKLTALLTSLTVVEETEEPKVEEPKVEEPKVTQLPPVSVSDYQLAMRQRYDEIKRRNGVH